MSDIEVQVPDGSTAEGTNVDITTGEAIVPEVVEPAYRVGIQPRNFVISTHGLYSGAGASIPAWLSEALASEIAKGTDDINALSTELDTTINNYQTGVNQQVALLQAEDLRQDGLLTTVNTKVDNNHTAVVNELATKTTSAEVEATASTLIAAQFNNGDSSSWFASQIQTYSDDIQAHASDISALVSTVNDPVTGVPATGIRLDSVDSTLAGHFHVWDGIEAVKIGMIKFIGSIQYQYLGGNLGEGGDGWVRTDYQASQDISALSAAVTADIDALQAQIDNAITTWFDDYTPDNTTEPWLTWLNTDTTNGDTVEQDNHTGDIFYDTSTGYGYRFTKVASVFSWELITDNAITQALAAASNAQTTADGKATVYYQATAPTGLTAADTGDRWINSDTDLERAWDGTTWIDITNATADQASGWAAGASKMITDVDGNVTGWSFGDGSNVNSTFKIAADKFEIGNGSANPVVPFQVNITDPLNPIITFTGVTLFNDYLTAGQTTIDGSKLTTGTVTADVVVANASISAPVISGGTIAGARIEGVNIIGSVIKSSWIDYTTSGELTNWQQYTLADYPTAYEANFAHDNATGTLVEDAQGYVRLQGFLTVYSQNNPETIRVNSSATYSFTNGDLVSSYDNYLTDNTNRTVNQTARFECDTLGTFRSYTYNNGSSNNYAFGPATETFVCNGHAVSIYMWYDGTNHYQVSVDSVLKIDHSGSALWSQTLVIGGITVQFGSNGVQLPVQNVVITKASQENSIFHSWTWQTDGLGADYDVNMKIEFPLFKLTPP